MRLIAGCYGTGDPNAPSQHCFVYENGSYAEFSVAGADVTLLRHVSSDGRYLTGTWSGASGTQGFAYDRQTNSRTDFTAPGSFSIAQGASVQGLVVGSLHNAPSRAFIFDLDTQAMTEVFTTDAGNRPRFRDINDGGLITGFDPGSGQAFVGGPGNWTVFDAPAGMTSIAGYGLNNQGDLVGYSVDGDGLRHGFYAAAVPEPAHWLLLALGLAALPTRRRRPVR